MLKLDITMSLDGFVAGPNATLERPLGDGGERLHEWLFRLAGFRERHGMTGGETDADTAVFEDSLDHGATIMGRRMFSGGAGPWKDDPNADGWWGDNPPFHGPVFVLTHHPRATVEKDGGTSFVFVADGIEAALEQATEAAGTRPVALGGGACVAQQYLKAGLLDEVQLHIAPTLLGDGVRLFDRPGPGSGDAEVTRVLSSPFATHIKFTVVKPRGDT